MQAFHATRLPRADAGERTGSERVLWYAAAIAGVAFVTLVIGLLRRDVQPSRLQMSYLLLVLPLASGGGRGPAILASVLAFFAFDWFFVKPVNTFLVGDPDEWFALGLFLLVGISTGSLAAGLKRSVAEARRRTHETAMLHELSIAILADVSLERVLHVVVERLVATLDLRAATVLLAGSDGKLALVAHSETAPDLAAAVDRDTRPHDVFGRMLMQEQPAAAGFRPVVWPLAAEPDAADLRGVCLPLVLNGRPLGVLSAYSAPVDPPLSGNALRLFDAFAAQTALAVGRVRLIEEEERARAAAESDRLKSIFLASISHDLRTPLTGIKTAAALMLSEPRQVARAEAKAGIDREVERLNHLLGNLMEMSRIESASTPPHLALEDLPELVGAVADRFTPLLDGRRLELSAPDDLPLAPLDVAQLDRVLTNLLQNAIKFSPAATTITVSMAARDGEAVIRTHNRGAPIPPGEQARIFEKFYRVQRDQPGVGGTGLGLAICKGIVEAHGGRIWTRNEDDGVAFYVALPLPTPRCEPPVAPQAVRV